MILQPPNSVKEASSEMIAIQAELDREMCPRWRRDDLEARLRYLRGYIHGRIQYDEKARKEFAETNLNEKELK